MGKYYTIDPYTCSIEELKATINNIKLIADERNNAQMGAKLFINSVYGALANQYYSLSNTDIAESITLQGQDLIKYAVRVINHYFREQWHLDTNTHTAIAKTMVEKYPEFNVQEFLSLCKLPLQFGDTLQCAGDTDSAYLSFQPLVDACHIDFDKETYFLMAMYNNFLEDYLARCFEEYAVKFNCPENIEEFALEKIFRSGIFVAKKKYAGDIAWKEPDIFVEPLHKPVIKGLEVIQGSTPKFCRKEMKNYIMWMLENINNKVDIPYKDIVAKLREIKTRFAMQSPDEMCKTFNVNDYEKYVASDKQQLVFMSEVERERGVERPVVVPMHVRGAAIYNNMLFNKAKKWKTKYTLIKRGDKVKFYYVKDNRKLQPGEPEPVFSFLPNNYPIEFAPSIDVDKMFEKLILDPLNRVIAAAGYRPVPATLTYSNALF